MFRLTISDSTIDTRSGISKAGRPYSIREQSAMVELPNGERRRVALQHDDGAHAYPPGDYVPAATAGYVDKFGGLAVSLRARHWQPVAAAARKVA